MLSTMNEYGHCNNCGMTSNRICLKGCVVRDERTAEMIAAQVKLGYSVANATAYVKRLSKYLANPNAL